MSVNTTNSGNSGFSTVAAVATAGAGAALGSALTTKYAAPGIINFAKNTVNADTFINSALETAKTAADQSKDIKINEKVFTKKAGNLYNNLKKFKITDVAQKAAKYAQKHPTRTAAIGAAVVGGIGALIGCAATNKSNESISGFQG